MSSHKPSADCLEVFPGSEKTYVRGTLFDDVSVAMRKINLMRLHKGDI